MKSEFWKNWKNKTELEQRAIKSIKEGEKIILQTLQKNKITAIYAMGSFVRREMNAKSDVDIMVILKDTKDNKIIEKLNLEIKNKHKPELNLCAYSLQELKTGKRAKSILEKGKPHPIKLTSLLPGYKLIYGKPIKINTLKQRTPKKDLEGMIDSFEEVLLPWYKNKIIDFDFLIKQVFWITYDEQRAKGEKPPHEWKKLNKFVKDKKHIVHEAFKFRLKPTKDKIIRKQFITKLKMYLKDLKK